MPSRGDGSRGRWPHAAPYAPPTLSCSGKTIRLRQAVVQAFACVASVHTCKVSRAPWQSHSPRRLLPRSLRWDLRLTTPLISYETQSGEISRVPHTPQNSDYETARESLCVVLRSRDVR